MLRLCQLDAAWKDWEDRMLSDPYDSPRVSVCIATILALYTADDDGSKWKVFERILLSRKKEQRAPMLLALLDYEPTLFEIEMPRKGHHLQCSVLPFFRILEAQVPAYAIAVILRHLPHLVMVTDNNSDLYERETDNGVLLLIGEVIAQTKRYPDSCWWHGTSKCGECSWCEWRNLQQEAVKSLPVPTLEAMGCSAMMDFYGRSFGEHFRGLREEKVVLWAAWEQATLESLHRDRGVPTNVVEMILAMTEDCAMMVDFLQKGVRELLAVVPVPTALQYWDDLGRVVGVDPRSKRCSLVKARDSRLKYAAPQMECAPDAELGDGLTGGYIGRGGRGELY